MNPVVKKNILNYMVILVFGVLFFKSSTVISQIKPKENRSNKQIKIDEKSDNLPHIYIKEHFNFGQFTCKESGTLTLTANGNRLSSGGVVIINLNEHSISPITIVVTAKPGTLITNFFISNANLNNKRGQYLPFSIGKSIPALPYITKNQLTEFKIGATLQVTSGSQAQLSGTYTGNCLISINSH